MFVRSAMGYITAVATVITSLLTMQASLSAAETTTIRIGYATAATSPHGAAVKGFQEELERLAPGRFEVQAFPSSALGGEREMVEAVQLGTLTMTVIGTTVLANFVEEMSVIDLPFLFQDYVHARNVMDGPVGEELLQSLKEQGIVGLAFGDVGFRHITNSVRRVSNVEDLRGLKLRTQENETHLRAFSKLGATPTPMAWPEVITALQQGTIDGVEVPMSIVVSSKLWETQKHLTLSKHLFTPLVILVSPSFYETLKSEDQKLLIAAAKAGAGASRTNVDQEEERGIEVLAAQDVAVVHEIDQTTFIKPLEEIYGEFEGRFPEIMATIRTTQ